MRYLTDEWYYFLADSQNRTCSWVNGGVVKNASPTPLPQRPIGWKEIDPSWGTNIKYWSPNRTFATQLKFVNDGANIVRWHRYHGKGPEEELYVLITRRNRASNLYELEYRGKINFSKGVIDDPFTGISVNTIEGGAFRYLNANDNVPYEIPCDSRNPEAIKVLFNGINLLAKYNYSAPEIKLQVYEYAVPITFLNSAGDSVDVVGSSQTFEEITGSATDYVAGSANHFFKAFAKTTVKGKVKLRIYNYELVDSYVDVSIYKNDGTRFQIYNGTVPAAPVYMQPLDFSRDVDVNIQLENGERTFLIFRQWSELNVTSLQNTQLILDFTSKKKASTAYALRPLTSGQNLVDKMSDGNCTLVSDFLSENDNVVATCGDALRNIDPVNAGIDGYNIKTTFADWFGFYNSKYNLGIKITGNVIRVEPKANLYKADQPIFDLGEVTDFTIEDATEHAFNSIKNGYPDQSYQGLAQNDGKLEVNAKQEWSVPVTSVNKAYDISSKWNAGCYIIEFVRDTGAKSDSSYNETDNGVFAVDISNETEALTTTIGTAIPININSIPSAPIIRTPVNNETIDNNRPTIRGYGIPGEKVGIIIDSVQEGFTTADANGVWSYNIVGALTGFAQDVDGNVTNNGEHVISAGFTDGAGTILPLTPLTTITIVIFNTASPLLITSPANGDYLYNNKPTIKGMAPAGGNVSISIDGAAPVIVTADGSCKWEYAVTVPLSDRAHVITAEYNGQSQTVTVTVTAQTLDFPLITDLEANAIICDNTPLIKGIAKPFETVTIYIDFITADPTTGDPTYLGRVVADANGNWSYQVTTWLGAPIGNGLHYFSTTPENEEVNITVNGYKLFRENYTLITGVNDDTIFNVRLRPSNQIRAHGNVIKSVLFQQPEAKVHLETASKNKSLVTVVDGVTNRESADIPYGKLGDNLFLMYNLNFKTKVPFTFEKVMKNLQSGYVRFTVKNFPIYGLPIGTMSSKPAMNESQTWKLLAAPNNDLGTFMMLSQSALFIQDYNKNMLSISNLNPLQWLKWGFEEDEKYNEPGITDLPFDQRHKTFISKPFYLQKWQKSDTISSQFITAGLGAITIKRYDEAGFEAFKERYLADGTSLPTELATYVMDLLVSELIQPPYSLQQHNLPLAAIGEDSYRMIAFSEGVPLAYTEWFGVAEKVAGSVLIEYSSSYNLLNGYFDTWSPMVRVEGVLMPAKPDSDFTTYEDEQKDTELLHAIPSAVQTFVIGQPFGIPDWMALKVNEMLLLNRCKIEGARYSRSSDSKMEETSTNGYPMSYYKTTIRKSINDSTLVIDGADVPGPIAGLIAAFDGETFGQAGSVINVTIEKE
ncbi:MAG: hypothetical protein V4450_07470 [Bacteroidota bacterium]